MENLNKVLEDIEKKGSNKEELKNLGEILEEDLKKDKPIDDIMNDLTENIKIATNEFFTSKNKFGINYMSGFSSGIYLPSFDNSGEIKLIIYGGDSNQESNRFEIDSSTMFDVASITKLFTLILTFKLSEEGLINLDDKISYAFLLSPYPILYLFSLSKTIIKTS